MERMSRTKDGLAFETLVLKAKAHRDKELAALGVRVPADMLTVIDGMAKVAKVGRADIVRMLLKVALVEGIAATGAELQAALTKAGAKLDGFRRVA